MCTVCVSSMGDITQEHMDMLTTLDDKTLATVHIRKLLNEVIHHADWSRHRFSIQAPYRAHFTKAALQPYLKPVNDLPDASGILYNDMKAVHVKLDLQSRGGTARSSSAHVESHEITDVTNNLEETFWNESVNVSSLQLIVIALIVMPLLFSVYVTTTAQYSYLVTQYAGSACLNSAIGQFACMFAKFEQVNELSLDVSLVVFEDNKLRVSDATLCVAETDEILLKLAQDAAGRSYRGCGKVSSSAGKSSIFSHDIAVHAWSLGDIVTNKHRYTACNQDTLSDVFGAFDTRSTVHGCALYYRKPVARVCKLEKFTKSLRVESDCKIDTGYFLLLAVFARAADPSDESMFSRSGLQDILQNCLYMLGVNEVVKYSKSSSFEETVDNNAVSDDLFITWNKQSFWFFDNRACTVLLAVGIIAAEVRCIYTRIDHWLTKGRCNLLHCNLQMRSIGHNIRNNESAGLLSFMLVVSQIFVRVLIYFLFIEFRDFQAFQNNTYHHFSVRIAIAPAVVAFGVSLSGKTWMGCWSKLSDFALKIRHKESEIHTREKEGNVGMLHGFIGYWVACTFMARMFTCTCAVWTILYIISLYARENLQCGHLIGHALSVVLVCIVGLVYTAIDGNSSYDMRMSWPCFAVCPFVLLCFSVVDGDDIFPELVIMSQIAYRMSCGVLCFGGFVDTIAVCTIAQYHCRDGYSRKVAVGPLSPRR